MTQPSTYCEHGVLRIPVPGRPVQTCMDCHNQRKKKRQVSVRSDTYQRLADAAEFTNQKVSKIVDKLINDFLDKEEKKENR